MKLMDIVDTPAPWLSTEQRRWFQQHLAHWLGKGASLALPPTVQPFEPTPERAALSRSRPRTVRRFFDGCLRTFRAVVDGDTAPEVALHLYGDLPAHRGLEFHRSLGAAAFTAPHSFRTDESLSGRLYEIQSPGSGWGELLLLADWYAAFHGPDALGTDGSSIAGAYAEALRRALDTAEPCVLYLTDTASGQIGTRYFIERTRAVGVRYYGLDPRTSSDDVRHIRSHAWRSLFTEHHPERHLRRAATEPYLYDPSLNAMFFSKITTALPFWHRTRAFFTDADRALFPYTALLEHAGVQLPNGEVVSRAAFAEHLRTHRYVLKYAGGDVYSGSGGSGIRLLADPSSDNLRVLHRAWDESAAGRSWIVQEALDARHPAWPVSHPRGEVRAAALARSAAGGRSAGGDGDGGGGHIPKLSVFCALDTYLGSMVMAGTDPIVHVGTSTALTVCAEPSGAVASRRKA